MPAPGNQRRDVVCNSGPLIGLAGIGQLELLARLYSRVLIPEAVRLELSGSQRFTHQAAVLSPAWLESGGWLGDWIQCCNRSSARVKQK
jgi:hypothetical protein